MMRQRAVVRVADHLHSKAKHLILNTPSIGTGVLSKISADIGYNQLQYNDLRSPPPVKGHFLLHPNLI